MPLFRFTFAVALFTLVSTTQAHADELNDLSHAICKRGVECVRPKIEQMRSQVPPEMLAMMEQTFTGAYCDSQPWAEASKEADPQQYAAIVRCFRVWAEASCDYYVGESDIETLPECAQLAEMP